jgi:hypothetical protein
MMLIKMVLVGFNIFLRFLAGTEKSTKNLRRTGLQTLNRTSYLLNKSVNHSAVTLGFLII